MMYAICINTQFGVDVREFHETQAAAVARLGVVEKAWGHAWIEERDA